MMRTLLLTSFVFIVGSSLVAQTKLEPGATKKITIKQGVPETNNTTSKSNYKAPEYTLNKNLVQQHLNWSAAQDQSDPYFGNEQAIKSLFNGKVIPQDFPINYNYSPAVYQKMVLNWCHKNTQNIKQQFLIKTATK